MWYDAYYYKACLRIDMMASNYYMLTFRDYDYSPYTDRKENRDARELLKGPDDFNQYLAMKL